MAVPRLLPPATTRLSGSVRLDGAELDRTCPSGSCGTIRGKDVSVVFQEPMTSLNPSFTVGYQITEVLRRHERLSARGRPDPRRRAAASWWASPTRTGGSASTRTSCPAGCASE